jgi:hypothetical protein
MTRQTNTSSLPYQPLRPRASISTLPGLTSFFLLPLSPMLVVVVRPEVSWERRPFVTRDSARQRLMPVPVQRGNFGKDCET